MADETWYRGEGIDRPPAPPGKGSILDFGRGMYLSDRSEVADVYAQVRPLKPENRRLWVVTLDRGSLGRVLDLTTDARWSDFMNSKPHDSKSPAVLTRRAYATRQQETYYGFFVEFLKKYKINIDSYDAVIGPEYTHNGRQLCILSKNEQPSKLEVRVRALFRLFAPSGTSGPAPAQPTPKPPAATGRLRTGIKTVGGMAVGAGINAIFVLVASWLRGKLDEPAIERGMTDLKWDAHAEAAKYKRLAVSLIALGKPAFANVTAEVETISTMDSESGWDSSPPRVKLIAVTVSSKIVEDPGYDTTDASFGQRVYHHIFKYSWELFFLEKEVDQYIAAQQNLNWLVEVLKNPVLHRSDVDRLTREKQDLEKWLDKEFGNWHV